MTASLSRSTGPRIIPGPMPPSTSEPSDVILGPQLLTGTTELPCDDSDTEAALATLQRENLTGHARPRTGILDRPLDEESGARVSQDIQGSPLLRRAG